MTRGMVIYHKKSLPSCALTALSKAKCPTYFRTNAQGDLLAREIEKVNPVAILTFGDDALLRTTGEHSSEKLAGLWQKVTHYRGDPLLVLPNLDPELVEENPGKISFFEEVVAEFVQVWQYALEHSFEETWRYAKP